jgi:PAS domain S-box-containing protein
VRSLIEVSKDLPMAISSEGKLTDAKEEQTLKLNSELKQASHYTRSLFEANLDPLATISADGKIMDVNEAAIQATGVAREILIGSDFCGYFTEPQKARAGYQEAFSKGSVRDYPLRLRNASGKIMDVLYNASIYRNEKGAVAGVFAAARDITELKLAEEALLRSNRERRAISDCNMVILRAAYEQKLLYDVCRIICDEASYRMAWVGYVENDDVKTVRPIAWAGVETGYIEQAGITWANTARGRGPAGAAIRSGESACIQDFATSPQAAPWRDAALLRGYRSSIALPLKDEGADTFGVLSIFSTKPNAFTPDEIRLLEELAGALAFGVMVLRNRVRRQRAEKNNIKLSQELEERVAVRTAQLEDSNKELESFAYSVSHDLRAPLRTIDGFTRILLEDYKEQLDEDGQRYLNTVHQGAIRLGQLIDDILSFSRTSRREIEMAVVDIGALAREVFDELRADAPDRNICLRLNGLPPARCDHAMIRQVMANLLGNAIKFTAQRVEAVIEMSGAVEEAENVYWIKDNGAGFDMNGVDRLFGVFQRLHTNREFEGTGIGLAIVKRIIERHGGRVWADGKVGEGAIVHFTLPTIHSSA